MKRASVKELAGAMDLISELLKERGVPVPEGGYAVDPTALVNYFMADTPATTTGGNVQEIVRNACIRMGADSCGVSHSPKAGTVSWVRKGHQTLKTTSDIELHTLLTKWEQATKGE